MHDVTRGRCCLKGPNNNLDILDLLAGVILSLSWVLIEALS